MALGSLRRARAQAETATPASALGPWLRALRGNGALGALAVGGFGLAALAGILHFKKDEPAREVPGEETRNEVPDRKGHIINDASIRAKFVDKDGHFACLEYIDYINFRTRHPEVTDPEVLDEMTRRRYPVTDHDEEEVRKIVEHDDVRINEAAMKARFEDWMGEYGRTYTSEEEKARRYEVFKENAVGADKANASFPNGARLSHNNLGDWTKEELYRLRSHQGDFDCESYVRRMSAAYAQGRVDGVPGTVDAPQEVECTEAVKQRFRELFARKAKQDARKAEGVHQADKRPHEDMNN